MGRGPAFYKLIDGTLFFGPNFVESSSYCLTKENKDTYTYPVDDWYWFDSEEDARVFFGLPILANVPISDGMLDPYANP